MRRRQHAPDHQDPIATAMVIVNRRLRESPEFRAALEATRARMLALVPEITTDYLRSVGGFSKLVRDTFTACAGDTTLHGSKILGDYKVADLYDPARDRDAIYFEVHAAIRARDTKAGG